MKMNEVIQNDQLGIATPNPQEVANKHNVSIDQVEQQLTKGIKVEMEHVEDETLAREIALDHLAELPDYYDRLHDMEND